MKLRFRYNFYNKRNGYNCIKGWEVGVGTSERFVYRGHTKSLLQAVRFFIKGIKNTLPYYKAKYKTIL